MRASDMTHAPSATWYFGALPADCAQHCCCFGWCQRPPDLTRMCLCSQHPAAMMHATARAVSGSSVYVSDFPGIHDIELLRRLVLPDGRVLRALLPGRPTRDSLFCDVLRDNTSLLKVHASCLAALDLSQFMMQHEAPFTKLWNLPESS